MRRRLFRLFRNPWFVGCFAAGIGIGLYGMYCFDLLDIGPVVGTPLQHLADMSSLPGFLFTLLVLRFILFPVLWLSARVLPVAAYDRVVFVLMMGSWLAVSATLYGGLLYVLLRKIPVWLWRAIAKRRSRVGL